MKQPNGVLAHSDWQTTKLDKKQVFAHTSGTSLNKTNTITGIILGSFSRFSRTLFKEQKYCFLLTKTAFFSQQS